MRKTMANAPIFQREIAFQILTQLKINISKFLDINTSSCKASNFLPSLSKDESLDCAQFLRRKASLECKASNFVDAHETKDAQLRAEIAFHIQHFLTF